MSEEAVGTVVVAGEEFNVVKTGREQASQVISFAKWIKEYGSPALSGMATEEGEVQVDSGYQFFAGIIEALDADALIELYTIVLGCSKKFAEEHFDIAVMIESLVTMYEAQPSFRRLLDRFFSTSTSEESTEESSTKSE